MRPQVAFALNAAMKAYIMARLFLFLAQCSLQCTQKSYFRDAFENFPTLYYVREKYFQWWFIFPSHTWIPRYFQMSCWALEIYTVTCMAMAYSPAFTWRHLQKLLTCCTMFSVIDPSF